MSVTNKPNAGDIIIEVSNESGRATPFFQQFIDALVEQINAFRSNLMNWEGVWVQQRYLKNDVVSDGIWTMIAIRATDQRAAPQPTGPAQTTLPDAPAWGPPQSDVSVIYSGHLYNFLVDGLITTVRVWVSELGADIEYALVITITPPGTDAPVVTTTPLPNLIADEWTTVAVGAQTILADSSALIYLASSNSAADSIITGPWSYDGTSQAAGPVSGGWNRDNQQTVVRINKTDDDGADRSAELLAVIPNSEFNFVQTAIPDLFYTYRVIDVLIDFGTYVEYPVVLLNTGITGPQVGEITTLTATVPIPQSTEYVTIVDHWDANQPPFATIEGVLQFDGVDQPGDENDAFGVDITFTEYAFPSDWEVVAYSGG